jgi:signal transduction histidine kinase/CheY-like chemotaxis protein
MTHRLAIWLALSMAAPAALGQHYSFRLFDRDTGLTSLEVRCLYQDRTGFLWAGTTNGLFRYESGLFTRFGPEEGLPDPSVQSIHETAGGTLWVATASGLARFEDGRFASAALPEKPAIFGSGTLDSRADVLYVATAQGLVTGRLDGGRWVFRRLAVNNDPGPVTSSVHVDRQGAVWYGCGKQLCLYRAGRLIVLGEEAGVPPAAWMAIGTTPQGEVFARSPKHVVFFRTGSPRVETTPAADFWAGRPAFDHRGRMLVPTLDGLAIRRPDGQWTYVRSPQGLLADRLSAVLQDREGTVWIGTPGFGLVRWPGYGAWETWGHAEGFANESFWGLAHDQQGVMWAATNKGVHRFRNGRWEMWPASGIPTSQMLTLASGGSGTLWVGSYPNGLYQVNTRSGRVVARFGEAEFGTSWVSGVAPDGEGGVWAATFRGLFRVRRLDGQIRVERGLPAGGDKPEVFYSCFRDRRGRVWGAGKHGLAVLLDGRWKRIGTKEGLLFRPRTAAEAPDGSLWVAYLEPVGVSHVEFPESVPRITHYTTREGLRSNMVFAVGFDRKGRLWLGSDSGVDVREGARWRHYGQSDGLAWNDVNQGSFLAGLGDDVWIGTNRGLSHFTGGGIERPLEPPRVMITSVSFGNSPPPGSRNPSIPFRDRKFHVRFTALTFQDERDLQFRYRVGGLDDKWISTTNRELHLKLPAGSYRFEVVASNSPGLWSTAPAVVSFRILPPWYQHPATIAGGVAMFGLLIWGGYRWRLNRLIRQRQRLEAMVEERTSQLAEARDKSEEANRLKSEFLARMSHEIRTPMNAVLGMTGVVLESHLDPVDREHLEAVKQSGESLLMLLNDLLDISRIEAGRMGLEETPFSLRRCVEAAARTHSLAARSKGLAYDWTVTPEAPDWLLGDPLRLRQILVNLLANAVKFTERGSIRLEVVLDRSTGEAVSLTFGVVDTGIGIAESKLALIREPFRQADGSTTRKYGGTGLGLAICDRLISLMGGRLYIHSEPGVGSRFLVELPFKVAATPAPSPALPIRDPEPAQPYAVLLAEDSLVNQKLAVRLLAKRGHTVTATANGLEALERFQEGGFDVVLMDIDMPVMDGLAATARIREFEKPMGTHVPVIAVTANAMQGDRDKCLHVGMDDFIAKPYRPGELYAAVEWHAARRRQAVATRR